MEAGPSGSSTRSSSPLRQEVGGEGADGAVTSLTSLANEPATAPLTGNGLLPSPVIKRQDSGAPTEGDLGERQYLDEEENGDRRTASASYKGKGRDYGPLGSVGSSPAQQLRDEFEDEQELREEQRIAENLRQWSTKEKRKRASIRRQSTIVKPVPPADLAAISEGISTLGRRGSLLLRTGSISSSSKRSSLRSSNTSSNRSIEEQLELSESRLPSVDEEHLHPHPLHSPVSPAADSPFIRQQATGPNNVPTSPPLMTHSEDERPPSLPMTHHHRQSSFVEDLPSQTQTTRKRESALAKRPDMTPRHSFQSTASDPFGDRHAATTATTANVRSPSRLRNGTTVDGMDDGRPYGRERQHEHAYGNGKGRRQRMSVSSESTMRQADLRDDEDEDDVDDDEGGIVERGGRMSVLDWLMCGCFGRPIGHEDQEARTNPME